MARKVFFSFDFDRDVFRASQIRNSNVVKNNYSGNDFIDAVEWEKVKKGGKVAIKKWIDNQLEGTSVTVVLIGAETSKSEYVNYEIEQSIKRGNGLLGIYIQNMKSIDGRTDFRGNNPFDNFYYSPFQRLSSVVPTYDWVYNDGYKNLGTWIENVAK